MGWEWIKTFAELALFELRTGAKLKHLLSLLCLSFALVGVGWIKTFVELALFELRTGAKLKQSNIVAPSTQGHTNARRHTKTCLNLPCV